MDCNIMDGLDTVDAIEVENRLWVESIAVRVQSAWRELCKAYRNGTGRSKDRVRLVRLERRYTLLMDKALAAGLRF